MEAQPDLIVSPSCPLAKEDCQILVDIVLRSSDGVLIGAHKKNLEIFSDGFPAADSFSSTEPVDLPESAETLKDLLQFVHKVQLPRVANVSTSRLFALANAAEKYVVFMAVSACNSHIEAHPQQAPLRSLVYGVKYNYPYIADGAARFTLGMTLALVQEGSGHHNPTIYAWLKYRYFCLGIVEDAFNKPPPYISSRGRVHECAVWEPYMRETFQCFPHTALEYLTVIADRHFDVSVLRKNSETLVGCPVCPVRLSAWCDSLARIDKLLPEFHLFL